MRGLKGQDLPRLGRWLAPPGAAGIVLVLLLATVALAAGLSPFGVLSPLPELRALDFSPDAFARIAPLRPDFIASSLGQENLSALLRGGSLATPEGPSLPGTRASATTPLGELPPILPEQHFRLRVTLTADRPAVKAGEAINYTVSVLNVGTGDFPAPCSTGAPSCPNEKGDVTIESHLPFGTTDATTPCNGDGPFGTDPPDCTVIPAPVPGVPNEGAEPGQPNNDVHQISNDAVVRIPVEKEYVYQFRVTVDPGVQPGTKIVNHAHATALGQRIISNIVTVTVTA